MIIVHYNTPDLLARCLRALQVAPLALLPIVVDTSSAEARARARQHVATLPTGHFVSCQNHSLAHAVNTGLQAALPLSEHPALVCMNADVFVRPDAWEPLLHALQPPRVGMVGPVCYDGRGQWQHQGVWYRQYYLRLQWMRSLGMRSLGNVYLNTINPSTVNPSTVNPSTVNHVSVPWLSGCLQVIKREALFDVGGMNSSLRFYNEDLEWCWRLRRAGWKCYLVDASGATRKQLPKNPSRPKRENAHQGSIDQQVRPVVHLAGSATPAQASFVVEGYRGGYRLSQMYRSPIYQTLHRIVLRYLLWQQMRKGDKATFDTLRRRLARGHLFESPFGDTLSDDNPRFGGTTFRRHW